MRRSWSVTGVLAVWLAGGSPAQEDRLNGGTHTLAEMVEWALRHSDALADQRARVEEKRLAAVQARTWPNPSVDVSVGRRQQSERAGPSFTGPLYEAALVQSLPWPGKLGLRGDLLDLDSETWRVRRGASEIGVTVDVIRLAYEYAIHRRKAEYVAGRQQRFDLIHSYLAGRVLVSPQKRAEARIVEQRLKGLVVDAVHTQAAVRESLEKLKVYVSFEPGPYPEVVVPWFAGGRSLDEQEWTGKALARNPDLAVQRLYVRSAETEKRLASREVWPDPSVLAFYGESTARETERNYGLGLGLSLPLWNRNRSGIGSARQKVMAEERRLRFQSRQLRADVLRLLIDYDAARKAVEQFPPSFLPDLEGQIKETEEAFRKGRVDLLTFLEHDSQLSETVYRALDGQAAFVIKVTALLALSGEMDVLAQLASFQEAR